MLQSGAVRPGRRRANDRGRPPISGNASDARLRPLRGFAFLIPILTVIFAALLAAPALAVPQAITDARGDLEALRSQVETLNDRVESSVEDYQYAKVQLADTEASLASTQKKLTRAEKDLVTAQSHMEQRIEGLYREGNLGLLDALLGARTFNDLINRFDLLKRVGVKDQEVYAQVASYRADVSARKATLAQNQAKQKKLLAESKAALASMKERLAERERALEGKEQQVAQLEAEEQARQARLAAQAKEAARQAAAAAKARQQTTTKTRSNGNGNASADAPSRNVPSSPVSGSVIDIAMQYMGVPYVWGGRVSERVRLLRFRDVRVCPCGRLAAALQPGAVRVWSRGLARCSAAGRPGLLRQPHPSCGHLRGWRQHDPRSEHRVERTHQQHQPQQLRRRPPHPLGRAWEWHPPRSTTTLAFSTTTQGSTRSPLSASSCAVVSSWPPT